MSTRNYFVNFVEIPIKKLNHHYFMNENGDILHADLLGKNPKKIYKWDAKTCHETIPIFNYDDNKSFDVMPSRLYMITFYGHMALPIYEIMPGVAEKMIYKLSTIEEISEREISINHVIFKQSNFFSRSRGRRVFVSESGVIYEECYNRIARHRFGNRDYNYRYYSKFKIHQLVYDAWIGPVDSNMDIHHIDNNDWNNDMSNLIQLSPEEHSLLHGRPHCTRDQVYEICKLLQDGLDTNDISEKVGVSPQAICDIRAGKTHKSITSKYDFPTYINRGGTNTTDKDIHEICELFKERKLNNKEIGKMYKLSGYTIGDIRRGASWKRITDGYDFIRERDLNSKAETIINLDEYKTSNQTISIDQVKEIWKRLQNNERVMDISREMDISYHIVKKIRYRTRWTNVTDQLGPLPSDKK